MLLNLYFHNEPSGSQMELLSCSSWKETEKIQTALTDHAWSLERKTQTMPWLTFFSVPQSGVGEEGDRRISCTARTQGWEKWCYTGQSWLSRRALHWKPFPPPSQWPILSMDIDLELERGRWAGVWWGICSTSGQNKLVRSKVLRWKEWQCLMVSCITAH